MEKESLERYKKFEQIIAKLDNIKDMESADSVLSAVLEMKKIEAQLDKLNEELLSKPESAMFYIQTMRMDEDEVLFAKQKLSSKIKKQRKKEEKDNG
mgnify:CR=1 FL=1